MEACDLLVGDHLTEKSANVEFVNAKLPTKHPRKLKTYSKLQKLSAADPNSTDIFAPSLIDVHYPNRPDRLPAMCLRRLTKPLVVNHPVFDPNRKEQEEDYYYCLILLFVPFTDETDLLLPGESAKQAFERIENDDFLLTTRGSKRCWLLPEKRVEIDQARKSGGEDQPTKDGEDGLQIKGKSRYDDFLHLDDVNPLDLHQRVSTLRSAQSVHKDP